LHLCIRIYKMEINYKLIENITGTSQGLLSSIFIVILILILFLRFIYPSRYILNIYKPNVYIFEYEAKQKNYVSFYVLMGSLINYLILFFVLLNFSHFVLSGELTQKVIMKNILFVTGLLIYKLLSDFIFAVMIKKINLVSPLRFIRISFENHFYFFILIISFFMLFYNYNQPISFIINSIVLLFFIIYSLGNFYISLSKHIHLKSSKIILYLCISEILPILFIIYWLSFQII